MELLAWIEHTDFSTWLRESDWGYPNVLCVHAVGMGMVVGISWMYCARVLGFAKDFPISMFEKLFPLAWFGFVINAMSGTLLFIGEPRRMFATPAFWIKMILIVCAGLALWVLSRTMEGVMRDDAVGLPGRDGTMTAGTAVTSNAKVAAVLSIVFWLSAITAGRVIGYTMPPPPL
jgi:hypothetical protein